MRCFPRLYKVLVVIVVTSLVISPVAPGVARAETKPSPEPDWLTCEDWTWNIYQVLVVQYYILKPLPADVAIALLLTALGTGGLGLPAWAFWVLSTGLTIHGIVDMILDVDSAVAWATAGAEEMAVDLGVCQRPSVTLVTQNGRPSGRILVTFSKPMDQEWFDNHRVIVNGTSTGRHYSHIYLEIDNIHLVVDPDTWFAYGETVEVVIKGEVRDLEQISMKTDSTWLFGIVPAPPPDPTSISVSANVSPSVAKARSNLTVSGTAIYDTGSPVSAGTASITTQDPYDVWTAAVKPDGTFTREIVAPDSSGPIVVAVEAVHDDRTLTGNTRVNVTIQQEEDDPYYRFAGSTIARGVNPYGNHSGEERHFKSSFPQVCVWAHFENVTVRGIKTKFGWHQPDGRQSYTTEAVQGDFSQLPTSVNQWSCLPTSGMVDLEGEWQVTIETYPMVSGGGGQWTYHGSEWFIMRYNLTEHKMAKGIRGSQPPLPDNPTNTFDTTDAYAYTWMNLDDLSESVQIQWKWYEPAGALYSVYDYTTDDPGSSYYPSYGAWGRIPINGTPAASKAGQWYVDVYIRDASGGWDKKYTDYFQIVENDDPTVSVSASPAQPTEADSITLEVSATDDTYLQNVTVYWNDGTLHSQTWPDILSGSFSTNHIIGSFSEGDHIEYYAVAEDSSGNSVETGHSGLAVADSDTEGPEITELVVAEEAGDGDGVIEEGEQVRMSWQASDTSGIASIAAFIEDQELTVVESSYYAIGGPLPPGTYRCGVAATDGDDSPASSGLGAEFDVIGPAPTLSWTGETNYVSDGLHPETGGTGDDYIYRIKYSDADGDAPSYVRVHIEKGGADIIGSPFDMSCPSGDYTAGVICSYTKAGLEAGTDYTYYFVAEDDQGNPATSTTELDAPDVYDVGPIVYDSHIVDDDDSDQSSGDGDGIVDCGESIELYVTLYNQGSDTATGVNATISENDPYVTFIDNTGSTYPDIPGGVGHENLNDFDFEVDPSTPDGHVIHFDLDPITASNGGPWSDSFDVPVVCRVCADPHEPNDGPGSATPISSGDTYTDPDICPAGDWDWYSIEATAGDTIHAYIHARVLDPPSQLDSYLYLYEPDGTTKVCHDDDSGFGFDSELSCEVPLDGTYYLAVTDYWTLQETPRGGPDYYYHTFAEVIEGGGPNPPTNLAATAVSQTEIDLIWNDNSDDESDFHIERRSPPGTGSWTEIDTAGANVESSQDSGLTCGTTYEYRARAHRHSDGQYSDHSNIANATTQVCGVRNGSFEQGPLIPKYWTGRNLTLNDRRVCWVAHHGSCSFKIVGTTAKKSLRQVVKISGSAGDSLTLSGWSKATNPLANGGPYCLQAKVFHTNGTKKRYRRCFAKRTHGWQRRKRTFTVDKDYNKIVVYLLYYKQGGKAWFDDVRLIKN